MNDESAVEEDQEEEYDSETDDETYDGEGDEDRSDDQFVNESSDEGVGGIENDYDSDGNLIDDENDYDEDDEDDAIGNVGNPNNGGGFHPLLHAHPMFQQALLQSLVQEEENTGNLPTPQAVAQIIQDMQQHFLQHHQHQHHDIGEEGEFEDQYDMMMFDGGGGGAYSSGSSFVSSEEEDDSFFRDTEDEESAESESESSSEEEEEGKREGRDAAERREHPHSSRISERIRVRDELEEDATRRTGRSGGARGENNNTRKRKNEMVEE